nr:MAG TPA: hypothetical protein [Caudoviricetes sp.]DAL80278.1 MAG TPA: hypothetical protein [Caudoviricetes sp.]DAR45803.1 MAG TPA: hypothetical protein [Bacteriophage sp.]DAU06272.1 MAG TPA: hypothetical protein [Caudoviricetes sp.]
MSICLAVAVDDFVISSIVKYFITYILYCY